MLLRGGVELLVFGLGRLAEALVFILLLWPPSLCLLEVDKEVLARRDGETDVLVFYLVGVTKA